MLNNSRLRYFKKYCVICKIFKFIGRPNYLGFWSEVWAYLSCVIMFTWEHQSFHVGKPGCVIKKSPTSTYVSKTLQYINLFGKFMFSMAHCAFRIALKWISIFWMNRVEKLSKVSKFSDGISWWTAINSCHLITATSIQEKIPAKFSNLDYWKVFIDLNALMKHGWTTKTFNT